ncbi:hypothetical protein HHK36_013886 [Tetracentron sinense]|uniref:Uncharacterized protein n=1 Tax=Tetracentron sinense TaxID=13715 RepID=A0A834Z724_TETSI|nr:hypothetical protein HHK36_013886 [Tetracentron sinense]
MILLHGFGASVFSWDRVMKPFARVTSSKVLAFDRPASGLTSRMSSFGHSESGSEDTKPLNPYSMEFSVLATMLFVNFLATEKAILVGVGKILSKFTIYIAHVIMRMLKAMVDMVSSLYKKALTAILLSVFTVMLVRMVIDKFGISAIRNACYDADQITDHVLQAKGWYRALVEYTIAMLADSASESKPPLTKRLDEISCLSNRPWNFKIFPRRDALRGEKVVQSFDGREKSTDGALDNLEAYGRDQIVSRLVRLTVPLIQPQDDRELGLQPKTLKVCILLVAFLCCSIATSKPVITTMILTIKCREILHEDMLVADTILKAMAKCVDLKENHFVNQFGERAPTYTRFNYYPPCSWPDIVYGIKHCFDGDRITIILQNKEVESLHDLKDGQLIKVPIIP